MMIDLHLPEAYDVLAPDGSEVRILVAANKGSMAHFTLPPRQVSLAVVHRTVEEVWYVLSGQGQMWRKFGDTETIVALTAGLSLTIPLGTHFQFCNTGIEPLKAVGVTMPPWPGMDEAFAVQGKW
jgi:mannose-6-phosphate isomerase-like protein (cupin superfamily)